MVHFGIPFLTQFVERRFAHWPTIVNLHLNNRCALHKLIAKVKLQATVRVYFFGDHFIHPGRLLLCEVVFPVSDDTFPNETVGFVIAELVQPVHVGRWVLFHGLKSSLTGNPTHHL